MKRSLEDKLLNPRPGSKATAARDAGIDLEALLVNLRLSPQERIEKMLRISKRDWDEHEKIINLNDTTRSLLCHKDGYYPQKYIN